MTIHLNLSGGDPVALMHQLKPALARAGKELRIELFGPGMLLADTALILFEILRNRPAGLQVHVHTWSCLSEGAVLLWLAGDTRSMRSDTWIEIPPAPESFKENPAFCRAIPSCDESPAETDLRTVLAHVSQWLPIQEVAGLRLFHQELREFGLLDDEQENQKLAGYFKTPEAV